MFQPDIDIQANSNLAGFLEDCGIGSYEALAERANTEPDWFWGKILDLADIRFSKPYSQLRDASDGPANIRWAVGGALNLTETLLDARIEGGLGDKAAIDWVGEDGEARCWSYRDLADETARVASALAARGIGPGDAVGIYMPMIPEISAAFLGIARLGAIVVPLFSGFSAPAIVARLNDSSAKAVMTVDATPRRGKPVPMEKTLAANLFLWKKRWPVRLRKSLRFTR